MSLNYYSEKFQIKKRIIIEINLRHPVRVRKSQQCEIITDN
jgi:hypothetical protein